MALTFKWIITGKWKATGICQILFHDRLIENIDKQISGCAPNAYTLLSFIITQHGILFYRWYINGSLAMRSLLITTFESWGGFVFNFTPSFFGHDTIIPTQKKLNSCGLLSFRLKYLMHIMM